MVLERNLDIACLFPVVQTPVGIVRAAVNVLYAVNEAVIVLIAAVAGRVFNDNGMRMHASNHGREFVHQIKNISKNLFKATPILGTCVAGNDLGYTLADSLSFLPITQTAVGILTVLSNVIKDCCDLAKLGNQQLIQRTRNFVVHYKDQAAFDEKNEEITRVSIHIVDDLMQHTKYVGVGLVRLLPIIGTVFTIYKINHD